MGMYTEFHFNVRLVEDVPGEVVELLELMVSPDTGPESIPESLPDHPLFESVRWSFMLNCDSYYFAADTATSLRFDDVINAHVLCVRCNLKNYSNEIGHFVDWIRPWVDAADGEFLGFSRYEQSQDPTIIRK